MKVLDASQSKSKLVNIPRGPQFRTKGNYIVAMIALAVFIIAIASIIHGEFITGFISLIISFALFYYILDFHGFQLDHETHRIRDYKNFLWIKFGKWENLKDFKSIYLVKAHLVVSTSLYSEEKSETFHYYHLKLVDETRKKVIFLAEYDNYYKALKIAENVANATGLELKDFLKGTVLNKKIK
jgi:hypothetical protein